MNIIRHIIIISIALLGILGKVTAQDYARKSLEILNEDNGLPNQSITSLCIDRHGFLWVGTLNGLARFDGEKSKIFLHQQDDSTSICDPFSQFIIKDTQKNLWLTYQRAGLSRYMEECECFDNSAGLDSLIASETRGLSVIRIGSDNEIWLNGYNRGLRFYNLRTKTLHSNNLYAQTPGLNPAFREYANSINHICESRDGLFWLATKSGLFTYDPSTRKFACVIEHINNQKADEPTSFGKILQFDEEHMIIEANDTNLVVYDLCLNSYRILQIPNPNIGSSVFSVNDIATKNDHELWITSYPAGIMTYDINTQKLQPLKFYNTEPVPGLLSTANKICPVNENLIYIASGIGLLRVRCSNSIFSFAPFDSSFSVIQKDSYVHSVLDIPQIHCTALTIANPKRIILVDRQSGRKEFIDVDKDIRATPQFRYKLKLYEDNDNHFWVLSNFSLFQFDYVHKTLQRINLHNEDSLLTTPEYSSMFFDSDNNMWIVSYNGGVHKVDLNRQELGISVTRSALKDAPQNILRAYSAGNQNIWLQTKRRIFLYNIRNNTFREIADSTKTSWHNQEIQYCCTDQKNNLYAIIPEMGIMKYLLGANSECNVQTIGTEDLLPSNKILDIIVDHEGLLWCSTFIGIYRQNPEANSFRKFKNEDGLPRITYPCVFYKNGDSNITLTIRGQYSPVNFENIDPQSDRPKVYIENIKVRQSEKFRLIVRDTTLHLSAGDNFISFDYGSIDLQNQQYNSFAYKLTNWDHDWIMAGSRKFAGYTNLDPGAYTFMVKVAGADGRFGMPLSVHFTIEKVFYKKNWFVALGIILLLGVSLGIYFWRIRQIRKAEFLKTRHNAQLTELRMEALRAQMNPHFIFNSLNSINRYIIKSDAKSSSYYLTKFAKLMRLILDNSKSKKVVLSNELEALKLYMEIESMRFDHKFEYEISIANDVDSNNLEIPPLIIQPYVENAIWHGLLPKDSPGKINLDISMENDFLRIELTDDGIGRIKSQEFRNEQNMTRKSLGMKLTEERLKMATKNIEKSGQQEIIDLYDSTGKPTGTKVILKIPVND